MTIWVDAQLPPTLATWLTQHLGVEAFSVKHLGYRDATDRQIFFAAREARAVVMTKDIDFVRLQEIHGPPPHVIWITLGNTSNARLREVLARVFARVTGLLANEPLVEISDATA